MLGRRHDARGKLGTPGQKLSSTASLEEVVLPALLILGGLALAGMDWPIVSIGLRGLIGLGAVLENPAPATAVVATPEALTGLEIDILPRKRWNARPPRRKIGPLGVPVRITIHHQGTVVNSVDLQSAARRIRSVQEYHQETKKWDDIAYHLIVDRAGRVWEGRPIESTGAHAGNRSSNHGNVGLLLLGDFDVQRPTAAQEAALVDLLEHGCRIWKIPRDHVVTHNEIRVSSGVGATACPGKHVASIVRRFRLNPSSQ